MITINGANGEGGGQIVRNACALSLVTQQPFHMTNIRGQREKPGLMRQHVTAIEAACKIGHAECEGLDVGSQQITFHPGRTMPGEYQFSVGTAGSTGLVLQTILLPLALCEKPSKLVLEGGTHNMLAPPFEFIENSFLPVFNRMGPRVTARLIRHGFYPRGGGRIEIEIQPASLHPIDCTKRGKLLKMFALAKFAAIPYGVAEREINTARNILAWPDEAFTVRQLPEDEGPGNILLLQATYENVVEVVSGFGKLGVSAEMVAKTAAARMAGYVSSTAFAGPYLADQLILPFALAGGGSFTTVKPSQHTLTAADIITRFLNLRCSFEHSNGEHRVAFS